MKADLSRRNRTEPPPGGAGSAATDRQDSAGPMPPAKPRTGSGPIGVLGPILAVLLVLLGVLIGREALVARGDIAGSSWAAPVLEFLDGLGQEPWIVAAGVVLLLVGLWLLVTALRPRSRSAIPVDARISLKPRDVARLASGAAAEADGVLSVNSSATRRRVVTTVDAVSRDTSREVETEVRALVEQRLSALATRPQVRVQVRTKGSDER